MGRTIKICELKVFDVYHDVLMNDGQEYMYLGDRWFCLLDRPQETFQLLKMDFLNCKAELLGRMEFVCDGKQETKTEFEAEMEEEYYRNNQGAQ